MKPGLRIWLTKLRQARRKSADQEARKRLAEEARRLAFHSPPLTPEEFDAGWERVEAERRH